MSDEKKSTRRHLTPKLAAQSRQAYLRLKGKHPPSLGELLKKGPPPIPECAAFGFNNMPFLAKLATAGLLCGLIGFSLPHWVYISTYPDFYATFGLWHYCEDQNFHCVLIHDNIIPGKDIPVWFIWIQWNFLIGVAMSLIVMAILVHNTQAHKQIRMSPTTYMAAECIGAIAALEKFISLYVFYTNFGHFSFLHEDYPEQKDFHGAFYCAIVSFCCDLVITIVLFLEEDIGPRPKSKQTVKSKRSSILIDAASEYERNRILNANMEEYLNQLQENVIDDYKYENVDNYDVQEDVMPEYEDYDVCLEEIPESSVPYYTDRYEHLHQS